MNYARILKCDIANGTGFRTTLYVAGCDIHCKGCFNEELWSPDAGKVFDEQAKQKIYDELNKEYCCGLTIIGGEPMSRWNYEGVIDFCKEVKNKFPKTNIWMYSGYTYEEILQDEQKREIFGWIDILVDGAFIEELKDTSLAFRGSSNQRIIDVKKTLNYGFIYEVEL